jgi:hypothetical protein
MWSGGRDAMVTQAAEDDPERKKILARGDGGLTSFKGGGGVLLTVDAACAMPEGCGTPTVVG